MAAVEVAVAAVGRHLAATTGAPNSADLPLADGSCAAAAEPTSLGALLATAHSRGLVIAGAWARGLSTVAMAVAEGWSMDAARPSGRAACGAADGSLDEARAAVVEALFAYEVPGVVLVVAWKAASVACLPAAD